MTDDKTPEDPKKPAPEKAEPEAPEPEAAGDSPTQRVIAAFGGIRPMAHKLGAAVSTIQGWKERDAIPPGRHAEIREAAERHGVALAEEDLAATDRSEKPKVETWVARDKTAGGEPTDPSSVTIDMEPAGGAAPKTPKSEEPRSKVPESGTGARAEERKTSAAEAEAAAPAPERRAGGGRLIAFLSGAAVVAAGFGLAVLTADLWSPGGGGADGAALAGLQMQLGDLGKDLSGQAAAIEKLAADLAARPAGPSPGPAPAVVGKLNDLEGAVAGLARRLARLEQRPAGSGASSDQLAALAKANSELGGRLRTAEERLAALREPGPRLAKLEDRLAGVEGRLAALDKLQQDLTALTARSAASPAGRDLALMIALIQLRDALGGPGPYAAQLDQIGRLAGDHPELEALLAPLRGRAASGIPTLAGLTADFSKVAGAVVAAGAGGSDEGALSGVLQRLSDVVTVRPVGNVEGTSPGAVVARVEHRLRAGDLPAALDALDALDGPAAAAAAAWRAEAEARLAANAALESLAAALVTRLARSGG